MLEKYDYYFLDIDGVLLDTVNYYATTFREMAKLLGAVNIPHFDYFRKNIGVQIEKLLCPIVPQERHSEIITLFQKINTEFYDVSSFTECKGATKILQILKNNNKKIAVISSKTRIGVELVFDHFLWRELIDFSITADDVFEFKPNPEGLLKAMKYFNIGKESPIFIGDSLHDFMAAKNADIKFLGVLTGCSKKEDWQKLGVKFINSIKDLK